MREVWIAEHGSLAGLEEALAGERAASRHRIAFETPRVDLDLPEFTLPTLEGPPRALVSLRGHVAVIDFWGTWCGPCVSSLPKLQQLWKRYEQRGVRFMAVDVEFEPEDLATQRQNTRRVMRKNHYTFPVVLDFRGEKTKPPYVPAFPTTWVVDREGRVRFVNAGTSEGSDQIVADQVKSLLRAAEARGPGTQDWGRRERHKRETPFEPASSLAVRQA